MSSASMSAKVRYWSDAGAEDKLALFSASPAKRARARVESKPPEYQSIKQYIFGPSRIEPSVPTTYRDVLVVVIPGNPGCAKDYKSFALSLKLALRKELGSNDITVVVQSHLGQSKGSSSTVQDLSLDQLARAHGRSIQHMLAFPTGNHRNTEVEKKRNDPLVSRYRRIVILGHSIGACLALQAQRFLQLFPTVCKDGDEVECVRWVVGLLTPILCHQASFTQEMITSSVLSTSQSLLAFKWARAFVGNIPPLLKRLQTMLPVWTEKSQGVLEGSVLESAISLQRRTCSLPPLVEFPKCLKNSGPLTIFSIFARGDPWVGKEAKEDIKAFHDFLGVPSSRTSSPELPIGHAFVFDPTEIHLVAQICAEKIVKKLQLMENKSSCPALQYSPRAEGEMEKRKREEKEEEMGEGEEEEEVEGEKEDKKELSFRSKRTRFA